MQQVYLKLAIGVKTYPITWRLQTHNIFSLLTIRTDKSAILLQVYYEWMILSYYNELNLTVSAAMWGTHHVLYLYRIKTKYLHHTYVDTSRLTQQWNGKHMLVLFCVLIRGSQVDILSTKSEYPY